MPRVTLTDALVRRKRPPKLGRDTYTDAVVPGLRLRITDKNVRSFSLVTRVHGQQIRVTLGHYPAIGVAEAREGARGALQAVAHGDDPRRNPSLLAPTNFAPVTFASIASEFLEKHAKRYNKSWRQTEWLLERYVLPRWGRRPVETISRRDAVALLEDIVDQAPYVANRVLAAVRKLFNWAVERGLIETTPVLGLRAPHREEHRERVLNDREVRALWRAADDIGYTFGPLFQLLQLTAQRRSEVGGMRWRDVDLDSSFWSIPGDETKSGRGHDVPLSPEAVALLRSLPRFQGPFVFSASGGEKTFAGFSKAKKRLETRARQLDAELGGDTREPILQGWRLHDVRRTAATGMARIGVPAHLIGRILNHAQPGVTAIYDRHSYLPEKRDALDRWARHLMRLLAP